jgi:REP element-mobilizing transposase RayT
MTTRRIPLVEGEYYHVYNRGNDKRLIFLSDKDREHFIKLLYLCNSTKKINFREDIVDKKIDAWDFERGNQLVSIGAWVIMPNHFHIFITPNPGGLGKQNNISLFIGRVSNAYSKYFNAKHGRSGYLLEGRFKSTHIGNEKQAKYLFSYIHLNPVKLIQKDWKENGVKNKQNALNFLRSYKWGSYLDYLGETRPENKILDRKSFLNYFPNMDSFLEEILNWINYNNQDLNQIPQPRGFGSKYV